jgi:MioC protein
VNIVILFGTETGVSEMVAEDIAAGIQAAEVTVHDLSDFDVAALDTTAFHLVVCSTYGDGELPGGAQSFHRALQNDRPTLEGLRYAMFGLGDSSYAETYSQGSEILDRAFETLGAERVGEYGRFDAARDPDPSILAIAWSAAVLEQVLAARV